MKISAFDLGTVTGFAVGAADSNDKCEHGRKDFSLKSHEDPGMRYLKFYQWLLQTLREAKPDLVVWEEVRAHKGTAAAHIYGGMQALLMTVCEGLKTPYRGVPVGTIKKHATGKGNADKAMMIQAAKARGYQPQDDNAADAIWLYHYAVEQLAGSV